MNIRGISYYLSLSCYPVAFLSFFNILYSSYSDHYLNFNSYLITLVISLLSSLIFYYFAKNADRNIRFYDQLILIFLVYLFVSLLISIPYNFSYYHISFINSYFEAISGLTTTGFTIFENVKFLDPTLIIWRSSSHWIGGFFFLIFLILIFSNFKSQYKLTNLAYNPDQAKNLFKDTSEITIKVFFLYIFLTGLIFILFSFSGIRLFNSFNLAMSVSSTGAFLPTDQLSEIVKSSSQKAILTIGLTFSALNIFFFIVFLLITTLLKNTTKIFQLYS